MSTADFARSAANELLDRLDTECAKFVETQGATSQAAQYVRTVEARYADQAWEIEVELPVGHFLDDRDIDAFRAAFDREHERLFGFSDPASVVEIVGWRVSVACRITSAGARRLADLGAARGTTRRRMVLPDGKVVDGTVHRWSGMAVDEVHVGPAIVESHFTSVAIDGARFYRAMDGSLVIEL